MKKLNILKIGLLIILSGFLIYFYISFDIFKKSVLKIVESNTESSVTLINSINTQFTNLENTINNKLVDFTTKMEKGIDDTNTQINFEGITGSKTAIDTQDLKDFINSIEDINQGVIENGLNIIGFGGMINPYKNIDFNSTSSNTISLDNNIYNDKYIVHYFNTMWNLEGDNDLYSLYDRIMCIIQSWMYKYPIEWKSQLDNDIDPYVTCVPTSASILLSVFGLDIDTDDLIKYFQTDSIFLSWARSQLKTNTWLQYYYDNQKLYQVTFVFVYGINQYLKKYYPDFKFKFEHHYWKFTQFQLYNNKYPIMIPTFAINWSRNKDRTGGHMIVVSRPFTNFSGNIIAYEIYDPFGNMNYGYINNEKGRNGNAYVISHKQFEQIAKSYYDDMGGNGSDYDKTLIRVISIHPKR